MAKKKEPIDKPKSSKVFCGCKHDYQDKLYGPGMRITVPCSGKSGGTRKCTVCSRVHP